MVGCIDDGWMVGCIDDGWMDKRMNSRKMDGRTDQHWGWMFCSHKHSSILSVLFSSVFQSCLPTAGVFAACNTTFLPFKGNGRKQGQIIRRRTPARPAEIRLRVVTAH